MSDTHWLWDVFRATGRISAYILYKKYMEAKVIPETKPKMVSSMTEDAWQSHGVSVHCANTTRA